MRLSRNILILASLCCLQSLAGVTLPSLRPTEREHAEALYSQVVARCCLRNSTALKVRDEIQAMVAEGKPDNEILAIFSRRFGGKPQRFYASPDNEDWLVLPVIGLALAAGWATTRWTKSASDESAAG